jgi:hypothetical protein
VMKANLSMSAKRMANRWIATIVDLTTQRIARNNTNERIPILSNYH